MNNGVVCDYFDYNGTRYYTGSKFKCNNFLGVGVRDFPIVEIKFVKYNKNQILVFFVVIFQHAHICLNSKYL